MTWLVVALAVEAVVLTLLIGVVWGIYSHVKETVHREIQFLHTKVSELELRDAPWNRKARQALHIEPEAGK